MGIQSQGLARKNPKYLGLLLDSSDHQFIDLSLIIFLENTYFSTNVGVFSLNSIIKKLNIFHYLVKQVGRRKVM